jgi:hypothetical protein
MKKTILLILLTLFYNATYAQNTALFNAIETAVLQKGVKIMVWEDEYSPSNDIRPWGTQKQECVNAWGANTTQGKLIAQASTEEYVAVANQIRGTLMQTKYNFAGNFRAMAKDASKWAIMKNAYQGACFSIIREMYEKQYNDGLMNAVGNWLLSSEMVKAGGVIDGTRLTSIAEGTKCSKEPIQKYEELVPSTEEIPLAGMNYVNRTFWLSTDNTPSKEEYFLGKSRFVLGNKNTDFVNIDNRVSITYYPGNDINLNGYVIFFSSIDRANRSYLAKQSNGLVSAYGRLSTNNNAKNKDFYWNIIRKGEGYIIQNLASGLYLSTQPFGSALGFAEVPKDKAATFLLESCDDDTFPKTPKRYLYKVNSQKNGKTISIIPPHLFGTLSLDEIENLGEEIEFLGQSGWKLADLEKLKELYANPSFNDYILNDSYWIFYNTGRYSRFRPALINEWGTSYYPSDDHVYGRENLHSLSFPVYWR